MASTRLVEAYVSECNAALVEKFLFEEPQNVHQAVMEAIDNCLGVLVGFQLLEASSDVSTEMAEVSLEKLERMIDSNQTRARMEIFNAYLAHVLYAERGDVSWPSRASWRLIIAIAAHVLRLSTYIRSKSTEENREDFFPFVQKARQIAQRLMQSQARRHARWVEGLSYVWQAFGIVDVADTKHRDQILSHAKRLLIEAAGTAFAYNRSPYHNAPSCLEEPCCALIGALCECLNHPLEAIWWYRKHVAEETDLSFTGLLPELLAHLQTSSHLWSSVLKESRSFCIEQVTSKPYAEIERLQEEVILARKHSPSGPYATGVPPAHSTPTKEAASSKPTGIVNIPIGTGKTRNVVPIAAEDNDYAMPPPQQHRSDTQRRTEISGNPLDSMSPLATPTKPEQRPAASPSPLLRSIAPSASPSSRLHSLSTVQFLERSRRDLELSIAMPVPSSPAKPDSHSIAISPAETSSSDPVSPISTPSNPTTPLATAVIEHPNQQPTSQNPQKPEPLQPQKPEVPQETMQERLKRRIELFGLEEHKQVPGDGNCQFYSLSDQLYQDFHHAALIRAYAVHWLRSHGDMKLENGAQLKEFGHDDAGWDHYCSLMSLSGTWGDHLTLVAVAELFQVRIVIISSAVDESQAIIEIVPTSTGKDPETLPVIFLCHYAEFHYGTLRQVQEE